jgi:hypothetical protein
MEIDFEANDEHNLIELFKSEFQLKQKQISNPFSSEAFQQISTSILLVLIPNTHVLANLQEISKRLLHVIITVLCRFQLTKS